MLPPEFKTIKQPLDSKICGACVAAMATGKPLADVEAAMDSTPLDDGTYFYRTAELLGFIGRQGIFCGLTFLLDEVRCDEVRLIHDANTEGHPAIVVVNSKVYQNAQHWVFWDGRVIRDPAPAAPDEAPISDYCILEWIPLTYIDDTAEVDGRVLLKVSK